MPSVQTTHDGTTGHRLHWVARADGLGYRAVDDAAMSSELAPAAPRIATRRVIVVGFDGGLPSRRALAWAARRAAPGGVLVMVIATQPEPGSFGRPGLDLVVREPLEHAHLALDEIALEAVPPDVEVIVVDDTPAHALDAIAREQDAEEIAIGGRAVAHEGDVATDLLSVVNRPVVVVR